MGGSKVSRLASAILLTSLAITERCCTSKSKTSKIPSGKAVEADSAIARDAELAARRLGRTLEVEG